MTSLKRSCFTRSGAWVLCCERTTKRDPFSSQACTLALDTLVRLRAGGSAAGLFDRHVCSLILAVARADGPLQRAGRGDGGGPALLHTRRTIGVEGRLPQPSGIQTDIGAAARSANARWNGPVPQRTPRKPFARRKSFPR